MQATVEATGGLGRQLAVQVPEDRIAPEVESRLKTIGRSARLPGFRPGKVPMRVIERNYGRKVREEVVAEVVRSSFADAVTQHQLVPASGPAIRDLTSEPGQGLSYVAVFEVYPQVVPPDPASLKVTRERAEVTDEDVDRMLETLRRQRREWRPADRAAASGDRVVLDYEGQVEGQVLPGLSGQGVAVELGSDRLIEGLDAQLVGAPAGEERDVEVTFAADHPRAEVAGKTVGLKVRVQSVEAPHLPEIDAAFVASFGVTEGGEPALRREVRENMERELAETLHNRVKVAVMDALLGASPFEVPRSLVEQEAERIRQQTREGLVRGGSAPQSLQLPRSLFEEQARRRVALGLLLSELVRVNGMKVDPERVRARVGMVASTYQQPEEVVRWYYADKGRLAEVENIVLEDQIVDWVLERASVTETPTTFEAVMKPGQTPVGG
jgi:trigger factor